VPAFTGVQAIVCATGMTASPTDLAAVQRAQVAYQQMLQHQHNVASARHKRERTRNIRLALVSVLIIISALAFGFIHGLPTVLKTVEKKPEPVDRFATTHVGQIRMPYKQDLCNRVQFNNNTGEMTGGSVVPCNDVELGSGASSPRAKSRLEALSDAFRR
jgi:hypothetical protein